jgi:hypothetical protein
MQAIGGIAKVSFAKDLCLLQNVQFQEHDHE